MKAPSEDESVVTESAHHSERKGISLALRFWYLGLVPLGVAVFLYWWQFYAFYDVGYAPAQPIPYSHKLHAGEYKMDCEYCHWNARKGKHAGSPPASVCLGCHDTAKGQVGADKAQVQLLLEKLQNDSYEWTEDGQQVINKEGGVVHWERVHLLPDHVYFSHEWHVKAGVSCQTCHGPIEEMEVVRQYADLSMGWCMECHRNDNYVGGAEFDSENDTETFRVGVGDYDVIRHRVRPDTAITFDREIDRASGHHGGHGDHHGADGDKHGDDAYAKHEGDHGDAETKRNIRGGFDRSLVNEVQTMAYWTDGQEKEMKNLLKKYPDLPRWRVQDLPESHRKFYGGETGLEHLQNAPTHCSTCHQ